MKLQYFYFLSLLFFCISSCSNSVDSNDSPQNSHFKFVLYDSLSSSVISDISDELEKNYSRIINDLDVKNMFTVNVKIWGDYNNFSNVMRASIGSNPGYIGYVYNYEIRIFYSTDAPVIAVHEFAHIVTLQVNISIINSPRWLFEAVAIFEAHQFIDPNTLPYMVSGDYPTLYELNDKSNDIIYNVGYILLEYVIETWGKDSVIQLIKSNGDIPATLGITFEEFESGWYQFVKEKYLK